MGATLVAQAYIRWAHVDDRPFRVLVKMALTAKDKPTAEVPAGLYFGGHDGLVPALSYKPGTKHDSKLRAVREAVAVLEAIGAVVCTQQAQSGDNAIYKLTLDAEAKAAPKKRNKISTINKQAEGAAPPQTINQAEGAAPTGPEGAAPTEAEPRPPTEAEGAAPPPYKEEETPEETPEELKKEERVALTTDLAVTRATAAVETPKIDSPPCRDPTCELGYLYDPSKPKGQRNIPCPTCRPNNVLPFQRKAGQ